jgi:DNA-binding NarL/FixJ family response regulator
LIRVLNAETDMQCSRDFDSCEKALAALTGGDLPDLILLDVGLPGMSGLDGIRLIKERSPKTLVVILTVFEDDDKVFQAICAGAAGYLVKDEQRCRDHPVRARSTRLAARP